MSASEPRMNEDETEETGSEEDGETRSTALRAWWLGTVLACVTVPAPYLFAAWTLYTAGVVPGWLKFVVATTSLAGTAWWVGKGVFSTVSEVVSGR